MSFNFNISLSVLNHLGRNLYRNFATILGEAVSNSWDAGATNVWITIDREADSFLIVDDGDGMDASDFQDKFLKIGYSKRKEYGRTRENGRPYIGAKGIGKLALLSCAEEITVISKKEGRDWIGGKIDNSDLDDAIEDDIEPGDYPLEEPNESLFDDTLREFEHGTAIHFGDMNEGIRNSEAFIRKTIAMTFRFSTLDPEFTIHLNGTPVTVTDLEDLAEKTQFLWTINRYDDAYIQSLTQLERASRNIVVPLNIRGFLATVKKPRDAKITGTDERASIDLFVNGRLREKNIGRHFPSQRLVESYLYGVVVFDELDAEDGPADAFTSSREGVKETEPKFQELVAVFTETVLPRIIDEWDELRISLRQDGDPENTDRKSRKDRAAQTLYVEASEDFEPDDTAPNKDDIDAWLEELAPDAEFNVGSYIDIFLSENLVRKYLKAVGAPLKGTLPKVVKDYRDKEIESKDKANISFNIRHEDDDINYLDMKSLAYNADPVPKGQSKASLNEDAITFKPMRDALSHTSRLSTAAKGQLVLVLENIKGRLRTILSQPLQDEEDGRDESQTS